MRVISFCTVPTVYAIDFTVGGAVAEDHRECSVECEVGRMSGSGELYQPIPKETHSERAHAERAKQTVMRERAALVLSTTYCDGIDSG